MVSYSLHAWDVKDNGAIALTWRDGTCKGDVSTEISQSTHLDYVRIGIRRGSVKRYSHGRERDPVQNHTCSFRDHEARKDGTWRKRSCELIECHRQHSGRLTSLTPSLSHEPKETILRGSGVSV